ncbi:MAG TPA: hypothetical protein VGD46_13460 [Rhizobacter sp.]
MSEDQNQATTPAYAPEREFSAILRWFEYEHLPANLQTVSKPTGDLARQMDETLPDCAEKSAGLRKLLEAKDCFVRAALLQRT